MAANNAEAINATARRTFQRHLSAVIDDWLNQKDKSRRHLSEIMDRDYTTVGRNLKEDAWATERFMRRLAETIPELAYLLEEYYQAKGSGGALATAGGPSLRDRTLAADLREIARKMNSLADDLEKGG